MKTITICAAAFVAFNLAVYSCSQVDQNSKLRHAAKAAEEKAYRDANPGEHYTEDEARRLINYEAFVYQHSKCIDSE